MSFCRSSWLSEKLLKNPGGYSNKRSIFPKILGEFRLKIIKSVMFVTMSNPRFLTPEQRSPCSYLASFNTVHEKFNDKQRFIFQFTKIECRFTLFG